MARAVSDPPQTLYDKIWRNHLVEEMDGDNRLIYVDRHLVHEVTSPQAFEGLRLAGRKVRRPSATLAVVDHNVPTRDRILGVKNPESRAQIERLEENAREFGVELFGIDDPRQGIVHVIGPEQGFTLPGLVVVCGDSHTATHGAFGGLAFGIGTSEAEHVLATQTLTAKKSKNMRISVDGALAPGVGAKDVILAIIAKIGTAGGTGYVIEYTGDAIAELDMAGRMTVCNMSIESGARAGMIAPDEVTFSYIEGRRFAPKGKDWDRAVAVWSKLKSDPGAAFDREVRLNADDIGPIATWGTSPEDAVPVTGFVPRAEDELDPDKRLSVRRALDYMGLKGGERLVDVKIDKVFIGSCTNGRLEDLRQAAQILKNGRIADGVEGIVVPGSGAVREAAEREGLDKIFIKAGLEWREPGCSMCLAMNDDRLKPGERCASTSNRNFEGRQGAGGRTHLMSPAMAAAAAVAGHIADVRDYL